MAAELLTDASRATDANSTPYSGAKWYFYATGGLTPQSVYTSASLATPHANPVVADAGGLFAPIYFDSALQYRGVLKDASGAVTIHDIDPINAGAMSLLAASGGSALVNFMQSGSGAVARTVEAKGRDVVSVKDFGASAGNATLDTAALNSAVTALVGGGTLNITRGSYLLSDTVTIAADHLLLQGDGENTSIIQFSPATAKPALKFEKVGIGGAYQNKINGFGFYSTNSVGKVALSLINQANMLVSSISISDGNWLGAESTGIEAYGRQSLEITSCAIACARPIRFRKNTLHPTLSTDHFSVRNCELIGKSAAYGCISFDPDVMHTNTTLTELALVGGLHGVVWEESVSSGASYFLKASGFRREQEIGTAGWTFKLDAGGQTLQTVHIDNGACGETSNGIYLRKAQHVTISNVSFPNASGTALDMTFVAGSVLVLTNCTFVNGSTITLTNAKRAFSSQLGGAQSQRGAFEIWVYDDPADLNDPKTGANKFDGILTSRDIVVASDGVVALSTNEFTGRVMIDSSVGTGATFYIAGTNNTVSERDDPYGQYSPTLGGAASTNVYWDAGTSRYVLQNKTGGSMTYTVVMIGRAV